MLSKEDIKNIIALINRANINGQEAIPTARLLQRLSDMLNMEPHENQDNAVQEDR